MAYGTQRFNSHSQGLSNNSYPEPYQPNYPHWYLSLQGPSNIVLPSTPRPSQKSLSCRFTFLYSGYMPGPSQSSVFNHPDYIRWTVQTMKSLVTVKVKNTTIKITAINCEIKWEPQIMNWQVVMHWMTRNST